MGGDILSRADPKLAVTKPDSMIFSNVAGGMTHSTLSGDIFQSSSYSMRGSASKVNASQVAVLILVKLVVSTFALILKSPILTGM